MIEIRMTKKQRKGLYSKLMITGIIIAMVLFTMKVLSLFEATGSEPSALIGAVFGAGFGQLWNLAMIKKEKVRNSYEQGISNSEINEP